MRFGMSKAYLVDVHVPRPTDLRRSTAKAYACEPSSDKKSQVSKYTVHKVRGLRVRP